MNNFILNFYVCYQDVNILPEGFVSEQLKSVMSDMHVDVVSL